MSRGKIADWERVFLWYNGSAEHCRSHSEKTMEALRLTMHSARLTPIIDLPLALRDRDVDVIVLPKSEESKEQPRNPKRESFMGCLSE